MLKPTLHLVATMAVQISSRTGMERRKLASAHQPKRKVSPIEAHKANTLERFAANCVCKSLSTVKI